MSDTKPVHFAGINKPIPTLTVVGPGGELIINESDLEQYRDKGYKVKGEKTPAPVKYDFSKHELTELQTMAAEAKIEKFASMDKPTLIKALEKSGFTPKPTA